MPQSKLAFFRYLEIDRMLRNKFRKYPSKQDLLEACHEKFGVRSGSTLEKDINAMRLEFDAPIAYSKIENGYYYEDPNFKLFNVNLSESHLIALQFVETWLDEFKVMPIFSEFSDAVDKVLDGLEITRHFNKESAAVNSFIQIDKSNYAKGSDILSQVIREISAGNVIRINYRKFDSQEARTYTVHPYLLKEYQDLWYLIGYNQEDEKIKTYALDRILHLEKTAIPKKSAEEVDFDSNSFFQHCFGITALDEPPQEIELSFTPLQGNYIKARPVHNSQVVLADNEQELRIRLKVVPNYELKSWILSFGAAVKVLKPESLRQYLHLELSKALAQSS